MSDDRISPYNVADCKNTTDDALQNYLTSIKFQQSHLKTDVKLVLGYLAVIISGITFAYDYKLGFDETKHYTTATVALYMLLNGAFTYWTFYVEKNIVFTGTYKGRKVEISTKCTKYDPTYRLTCKYATSTSNSDRDMKEIEVTSKFMRWFTADGYFVAKPFQDWIASRIPPIAEADPNVVGGQESPKVAEDAFVAPAAETTGSKTGASGAGGQKKRRG